MIEHITMHSVLDQLRHGDLNASEKKHIISKVEKLFIEYSHSEQSWILTNGTTMNRFLKDIYRILGKPTHGNFKSYDRYNETYLRP